MDKIYSIQYKDKTILFNITPEDKGIDEHGHYIVELHANTLGEAVEGGYVSDEPMRVISNDVSI